MTADVIGRLAARGLVSVIEEAHERDPFDAAVALDVNHDPSRQLTGEQAAALQQLEALADIALLVGTEIERRDLRRTQVGTGDRSEKIRTYNFHDNRITDHRVGFSVHQLDAFLKEGQVDDMVARLQEEERAKKLEALGKK